MSGGTIVRIVGVILMLGIVGLIVWRRTQRGE